MLVALGFGVVGIVIAILIGTGVIAVPKSDPAPKDASAASAGSTVAASSSPSPTATPGASPTTPAISVGWDGPKTLDKDMLWGELGGLLDEVKTKLQPDFPEIWEDHNYFKGADGTEVRGDTYDSAATIAAAKGIEAQNVVVTFRLDKEHPDLQVQVGASWFNRPGIGRTSDGLYQVQVFGKPGSEVQISRAQRICIGIELDPVRRD